MEAHKNDKPSPKQRARRTPLSGKTEAEKLEHRARKKREARKKMAPQASPTPQQQPPPTLQRQPPSTPQSTSSPYSAGAAPPSPYHPGPSVAAPPSPYHSSPSVAAPPSPYHPNPSVTAPPSLYQPGPSVAAPPSPYHYQITAANPYRMPASPYGMPASTYGMPPSPYGMPPIATTVPMQAALPQKSYTERVKEYKEAMGHSPDETDKQNIKLDQLAANNQFRTQIRYQGIQILSSEMVNQERLETQAYLPEQQLDIIGIPPTSMTHGMSQGTPYGMPQGTPYGTPQRMPQGMPAAAEHMEHGTFPQQQRISNNPQQLFELELESTKEPALENADENTGDESETVALPLDHGKQTTTEHAANDDETGAGVNENEGDAVAEPKAGTKTKPPAQIIAVETPGSVTISKIAGTKQTPNDLVTPAARSFTRPSFSSNPFSGGSSISKSDLVTPAARPFTLPAFSSNPFSGGSSNSKLPPPRSAKSSGLKPPLQSNPSAKRKKAPRSAFSEGSESSQVKRAKTTPSPSRTGATSPVAATSLVGDILPYFAFRLHRVDGHDLTFQPKSASRQKPPGKWEFQLKQHVGSIVKTLGNGEWNAYLVGDAWKEEYGIKLGTQVGKASVVKCYLPRVAVHCILSSEPEPDTVVDVSNKSYKLADLNLGWEKITMALKGVASVYMLKEKRRSAPVGSSPRTRSSPSRTSRYTPGLSHAHLQVISASVKHFKIYPENLTKSHRLSQIANDVDNDFGFGGSINAEMVFPDVNGAGKGGVRSDGESIWDGASTAA